MQNFDLTIIGGGLVGTSLALALSKTSFKIALIENHAPSNQYKTAYDTRSIALNYHSQQFLAELGVWKLLLPFATPIEKIHISEQKRFGKTLLDAKKLNLNLFGYVVPVSVLYKTLYEALKKTNITLIQPANLKSFEKRAEHWNLTIQNNNADHNSLTGMQDSFINTSFLVAADGDKSFIRKSLHIETHQKDYQQTAIVSTVAISKPHQNTAYERFTPHGVLAVLPREEGRVAIIWTVTQTQANHFQQHLLSETQSAMGHKLGRFSGLGNVATYPLKFMHAKQQVLPGVVLLGNAVHILHPVAAQGLNLGLKDTASLAKILSETQQLKSDLLLKDYQIQREASQKSSETFTQNLVNLFTPQFLPLSLLRSAGLSFFDALPLLQRRFCLKRMGMLE